MEPIPVWCFIKVEVATDGGLSGHFWLRKKHDFVQLPPIGFELDYRSLTGETVILSRIMLDPVSGVYSGYQDEWFSIGVGQLELWEHAGWQKLNMTDADVKANK